MESTKHNKLVSVTEKKQTHREKKLVITSGDEAEGRDNRGVGKSKVQTIMYKIGYIAQHGEYSQNFAITINGV